MTVFRPIQIFALVPFLFFACGGGGGGGAINIAAEDETTLAELSQGELDSVCDQIASEMERLTSRYDEEFCTVMSVAMTLFGGPEACEQMMDTCSNGFSQPPDDEECFNTAELASCDVTVLEFETCLNDSLDATEEMLKAVGRDNPDCDDGIEALTAYEQYSVPCTEELEQRCEALDMD